MPEAKTAGKPTKSNREVYKDKEKPTEIRFTNINAAKGWEKVLIQSRKLLCYFSYCLRYFTWLFLAVASAIRTSLGPKGMDKMVWHFICILTHVFCMCISIYLKLYLNMKCIWLLFSGKLVQAF